MSMIDSGRVLVSSPRKFSRTKEKAYVSFYIDENTSRDIHEQGKAQGTKPVEVYAFVGAISSIVAFVLFVVWAYFPETWLHSLGITYYPDRYWAIAVPSFIMVTVLFVIFAYVSLNYMATPSPDSLKTLFDEHTRQPVTYSGHCGEKPIDPISDMAITEVNRAMFA